MQTHSLDELGSFAWLADPTERAQRASSAIVVPDGVLLIDPVDSQVLDVALQPLGRVVAVCLLLDRHNRDSASVAARHGAPLISAATGELLAVPGVEVRRVVQMRRWREVALWLPERRLLVCPEAIGTAPFFLARDSDLLGVHPLLRPTPPRRAFAGLAPEAIACGHGPPLTVHATEALEETLRGARRDLPRALLHTARLAFSRS